MNPFRLRIDQGEISSFDELKAWYRAEVKRLHPDLRGEGAPGVDFDRLKKQYHEAYRHLLQTQDRATEAEPTPSAPGLGSREAFLDEFRNLVARGFPVNIQAAAKNRAYAASIRLVSAWLADRFADPGFFVRANAETRSLKRTDPTAHWYLLQIFWNINDYRFTGYDYYRRIYVRHWAFIRETIAAAGYATLVQLLAFLVEQDPRPGPIRPSSTPTTSK
jgi:hypothetical protein